MVALSPDLRVQILISVQLVNNHPSGGTAFGYSIQQCLFNDGGWESLAWIWQTTNQTQKFLPEPCPYIFILLKCFGFCLISSVVACGGKWSRAKLVLSQACQFGWLPV
ncbi:hypothetical protein SDJN02_13050, partial [Cucurbita argyrosperma subsp. argyrosperma]